MDKLNKANARLKRRQDEHDKIIARITRGPSSLKVQGFYLPGSMNKHKGK